MQVLQQPEQKLRQQSVDVVFFDDFLQLFVDQLIDTMYTHEGIGIAAPQVGVNRRIIVVDPSGGNDARQMIVMVNPKIVSSTGSILSEEGCLSVEGLVGTVQRAAIVDVEYQDTKGNPCKLTASGRLAVIIQHEIDHLFGILFIDRAVDIKSIKKVALERTA